MVAEEATSLRRALEILFTLDGDAGQDGGLGVTRVAALVGRDKSQVSRTLKVLASYGLAERDAQTRGYRLGPRLFALAGRAARTALLAAGDPLLRRLVGELGETAHLSLLQGAEVLTVLSESPNRSVQAADWVGRTAPVYCTSSGRALLFDHDREALGALMRGVELDGVPGRAPKDLDDLYARIQSARRLGFALVEEEFEPGLVAVAAPVRDFSGRVSAAINVSAPQFRLGEGMEAAGQAVRAAADELSAQLGSVAGDGGTS